MDPIRFTGQIRYWNPEKAMCVAAGVAVGDDADFEITAVGRE